LTTKKYLYQTKRIAVALKEYNPAQQEYFLMAREECKKLTPRTKEQKDEMKEIQKQFRRFDVFGVMTCYCFSSFFKEMDAKIRKITEKLLDEINEADRDKRK